MFELNAELFLSTCITFLFMGLAPLATLLTMCGKKALATPVIVSTVVPEASTTANPPAVVPGYYYFKR